MRTMILHVRPENIQSDDLAPAVNALLREDVIGFPTETVYGLGGIATSSKAVRKIYRVKGRPSDNPLIVHVSRSEDFSRVGIKIPDLAFTLAKAFWPGPLTLVVKRSPLIVNEVTKGLDTVAVRVPSHPVAQALLELTDQPIAAPSANLSGRPSPTSASHVLEDFNGKIPVIIDSGRTGFGVESTVLNVLTDPPTLLRPGGVTVEELLRVIPKVMIPKSLRHVAVLSPGMKYRHYSPSKPLTLIVNAWQKPTQELDAFVQSLQGDAVLYCTNPEHRHDFPHVVLVGSSLKDVQAHLFETLRSLDHSSFVHGVIEGVPEHREGLAIMNRLKKAASKQVQL